MIRRFSHYFLCFALFITLGHATSYNCSTIPRIGGAIYVNITGINNSAAVVGYYAVSSPFGLCGHDQACHGFRGDLSSGFTTVDYPGAASTQLMAVNNNGVATGTESGGTLPGATGWFTVTASGVFTNVSAPSPYSLVSIYGINDNGAISAVVTGPSGNSFAILQPNGSVTLVP